MNFKLIALNIKQFCPGLSIPVIKQRINVRYQQIINKEDWNFLVDSEVVELEAQVSNGSTESCDVTNGSAIVSGTGTSWTSDMEGKMFRVGTDSQFYRISAVGGVTSLTLEDTYAGDTDTGLDFSYWSEYYSPANGETAAITGITYQTSLEEKSPGYIRSLDPERDSTGSPVYYSVYKRASSGGIVTFDIWPVPDDNYGVTVFYKKTVSDLSADTDEPLVDSALLEAGALWDCFRLSFGMTQNPAFVGMARDARLDYQQLLREAVIEDLESSSMRTKVLVSGSQNAGLWSDEFLLDHDV